MINPSEFFRRYQRAAQSRNKQDMVALYHREVELFDMWNAYHLQGIDNVSNMVDDWFNSLGDEQLEIEFSAVNTRQDAQITFSYGFVHYRALDKSGTVLRQMKNRMTVCLINVNREWSVLHQHTSIPISLQDMKGVFE